LRDRDIRSVEPGESIKDKEDKLIAGISNHYKKVCEVAGQINDKLAVKVPVVAMGHLFTAGGKLIEGDGVRDLYIGSLARVRADVFSDSIDYVALGHLHIAQKVAGLEKIRYSGSPIPMGFGEALQKKKVLIVDLLKELSVKEIIIPKFQNLVQIKGDLNRVRTEIEKLKIEDKPAWLEIIYTGLEAPGSLRNIIEEDIAESLLEVLRIKNHRISAKIMGENRDPMDTLDLEDMDKFEVFQKCMDTQSIPASQQPDLISAFSEIVKDMQEQS